MRGTPQRCRATVRTTHRHSDTSSTQARRLDSESLSEYEGSGGVGSVRFTSVWLRPVRSQSVRSAETRAKPLRAVLVVVSAMLGLGLIVSLSGCVSPAPKPSSTSTTASTPTATQTTAPPAVLLPDGTAEDNKPFFDQVNRATLKANAKAGGRDFIDALVAAGFDKKAMEVTKDETTIGNVAESIQFSVRWGDNCLIGQNGSAVDGYHSTIAPALSTGKCLIGNTRPIDW